MIDSPIEHLNDAQLTDALNNLDRPLLVDFWAAWCGPCRMLAPEIEKIARRYDGRVRVVKVDTDANQEYAAKFGIMSIPTMLLFAPGDAPQRVTGYHDADSLATKFNLDSIAASVSA